MLSHSRTGKLARHNIPKPLLKSQISPSKVHIRWILNVFLKVWLFPKATLKYFSIYIRGFTKFGVKVAWSLQFLGYLRTKFQTEGSAKLRQPTEQRQENFNFACSFLKFFTLKVLKYPRNCRLHATLMLNVLKKSWID